MGLGRFSYTRFGGILGTKHFFVSIFEKKHRKNRFGINKKSKYRCKNVDSGLDIDFYCYLVENWRFYNLCTDSAYKILMKNEWDDGTDPNKNLFHAKATIPYISLFSASAEYHFIIKKIICKTRMPLTGIPMYDERIIFVLFSVRKMVYHQKARQKPKSKQRYQ